MRGKKQKLVVGLILLVLALALLGPVVRHPGWWIWTPGAEHSDLAVTHWPNAHFTRRTLWEYRQFPLWRSTIMSGTPFAANPLAGLYYPPNWLFLFLPWLSLEVGFNLSALAHLWLAGAAMYALLRRGFGVGVWGALTAAVVYEASPKLLAHLGAGHVGWVQAWGWLPVVVLCWLEALWGVRSRRQKVGSKEQETRRQGDKETVRRQFGIGCGRRGRHSQFAILAGVALAMQFCADVRMAAYTLVVAVMLMLAWTLGQVGGGAGGPGDGGIRRQGGKETRGPRDKETGSRGGRAEEVWSLRFAVRNLHSAIFSLAVFLSLTACQWLPVVALLSDTTRASMTLRDATVWSLPWQYLAGLLLANHGGFHEWMTYVGVSTLVLAGVGVGALWRKQGERWLVGWLVGLLVGAVWFSLGENGGLFQVLWRVVPGLGLLRVPPRAWVLVVFALAVLAGLGVEEARRQGSRGARRRGGLGARRLRRRRQVLPLAVGVFPAMLAVGYWLVVGVPPLNLVMFGLVTPLAVALVSFGSRVSRSLKALNLEREAVFGLAVVLLVVVDLLVVDVTLIDARSPDDSLSDGRMAAEWLAAQPGRFRVYSPSYSIPQHVVELYGLELADGVDPLQLRVYVDYLTRAAGLGAQGYSVTLPPFPEGTDIRTALKDATPDAEMLGRLGVRYVAAAFPVAADGGDALQLEGQFDGVYVYRNRAAQPVAETGWEGGIVLSDGAVLFEYKPGPVYVGWAVSGTAAVGLLAGWLILRRR